jgi:hypothetical protein
MAPSATTLAAGRGRRPRLLRIAACAGLLAALVSCSSSSEEPGGPKSAPPPDDGFIIDGDLTHPDGSSCVTEVHEAEALPFDLYVLFDQSGSMSTPAGSGSRLDAVRAAMADFLRDSESGGMGLGIGYFGNNPIGSASCNPADYQKPAVPIELLPANASPVLNSLSGVKPTGETPTGAALRGACTYAKSWRAANPDRSLDILLLTDGIPEAPVSRANGCDPTLDDAATAASECAASAGVKTFVLGVGPSLESLERIAVAGGTEHALLVSGGDVTKNVTEALGRVRGTALPCSFKLPPPPDNKVFNLEQVNVVLTDENGTEHALVNSASSEDCSESGGWYYGPGSPPERIELCPASCEFTKAQSNSGRIQYAIGCRTITTTR